MNRLFKNIGQFLSHRFNLREDKAPGSEIIESIRKGVEFSGVNLWALIFAIFIASIGLNVNSTAVIIGAMLISPIMGPVMGIGLGVGIDDLALVKKGAKNLLVATVIAILTSSIYFFVSPLHDARSELLARTLPSIWDVFIAFFGGAAGMIAASRKEKSNVIPGVAIATALMPPLCTAGFGIATGNWLFVLGALYLYFINSVFIAIATYIVTRYLEIRPVHPENIENQKKARRYIIIIVIITVAPSILMAVRIVNRSIFESNASKFVDEQFHFRNPQVVSKSYHYISNNNKFIEVLLIGRELTQPQIDSLNRNLLKYNLKNVKLKIRQGLNAKQQIDLSQIKASILEDIFNNLPKPDTIKVVSDNKKAIDQAVVAELKILYPNIVSFGLNKMVIRKTDTTRADTVKIALVHFKTSATSADKQKLQSWLRVRYQAPALKLIVE